MNREEWYKQRRLCRLKRLVYQSYGDEAPTKVYEATLKFPDAITKSVMYGWRDTSGYDIREGMARLPRVKAEYPLKLGDFKRTLRSLMRSNANMARITHCGCTPCDWFRG
jgi:hypothetical protein